MPNTYLFPTDGSNITQKASEFLKTRLQSGDSVIVIHVLPDPFGVDWETDYNPVQMETALLEAGERIVQETSENFNVEGVELRTEVTTGDPGEQVVEKAGKAKVDAIVMGRQGRGAASEILLGSVSHYVTHHAPCPVTVIPAS